MGFNANTEDINAVGRNISNHISPLNERAQELSSPAVSGDTVGAPFHYAGEDHRARMGDISKGVDDYSMRISGIANALTSSAGQYDSVEGSNTGDIGNTRK